MGGHPIREDATVAFHRRYLGTQSHKNPLYKTQMRRMVVDRPDKSTPLIRMTNDFDSSAQEIASLDKSRWDIALFFQWIKQNLKIKRFLGRSENAVRTPIFTALIAYLLVYGCHQKGVVTASLTLFVSSLRHCLFQRPETAYQVKKRRRKLLEERERLQTSWAF